MAGETSVVDVQISVLDAIPKVPSFGLPLVVGSAGTGFLGMRTYTADSDGLSAMLTDGIPATSAVKRTGDAIAAADPGISNFKVWNRAVAQTQSFTISPTITTQGFKYTFTLDGIAITYTNGAAETTTTIATAMELLTEAVSNVTSSAAAGVITIGPTAAGTRVALNGVGKGLTILDTSADGGIVAELNAAILEDPDFDCVMLDSNSKTETVLAAAWCVANGKVLYAHSIDTIELSASTASTSYALGVLGTSNKNVILFNDYDTAGMGYASAIASYLTYHPGSANLNMWSFVATGEARAMTPTEAGFQVTNNVSVITTVAGVKVVKGNSTPGGRKLGAAQSLLYMNKMIQLDVITLLISQPKVPFSPLGISQIQNVMMKRLLLEEDAGMLLPGSSSVTPKLFENTTLAERSVGLLDSMKFQTTIVVGIDKIIIKGTMSL